MYHEIEGQLNMETLIFEDDELIAGEHHYPYSEIESLKITSAPLFGAYGILTLRTGGRDIPIPFARTKKGKLEAALREFDRLKEKGEVSAAGSEEKDAAAVKTAAADPYEEVKKLKELLDMDIITKEEFETKKKQLLDL